MGPGGLTLPSGGFARRCCHLPSAIPRRSWVALGWPWWSLGGALEWLWCGLGGALRCLCTPESMPSIWLCGGFEMALGGFAGTARHRDGLAADGALTVERSLWGFGRFVVSLKVID